MVARDQLLPAFISALLRQGVQPYQVEQAVTHVKQIRLGEDISGGDSLLRAFSWEQAQSLERAT